MEQMRNYLSLLRFSPTGVRPLMNVHDDAVAGLDEHGHGHRHTVGQHRGLVVARCSLPGQNRFSDLNRACDFVWYFNSNNVVVVVDAHVQAHSFADEGKCVIQQMRRDRNLFKRILIHKQKVLALAVQVLEFHSRQKNLVHFRGRDDRLRYLATAANVTPLDDEIGAAPALSGYCCFQYR